MQLELQQRLAACGLWAPFLFKYLPGSGWRQLKTYGTHCSFVKFLHFI